MRKRIIAAVLLAVLVIAVSGCQDIYMSQSSKLTLQKTTVLAEEVAKRAGVGDITLDEAKKYINGNAVSWRLFLDFAEGKKASK